MSASVLEAKGVSKSFPGVQALRDVDIDLAPGEIHALIGENGAGKSTLVSILAGALRPSTGEFAVNGTRVEIESPMMARELGIAAIYQELAIQPWLSVTANVMLGNEPGIGPGRQILSRRRAEAKAREALARLGAEDIPLRREASNLSTGQKQLVEIARALAVDARVLILDEPTSSLPARDVARLLEILRQLRDADTAILLVSHRLEEIQSVADRVTVLREGRRVATEPISAMSINRMIELMTGREVGALFPPRTTEVGDVVLRGVNLTTKGVFEDVSFNVRSGEIVGFAGLIGAGRSEVMRAIYGADPLDHGAIELGGRRVDIKSPRDALANGIAYLPEDRKEQGLVLSLPARDNMVMATLRRFSRLGVMSAKKIRTRTDEMAKALQLRGRIDLAVANLSGGNQQKVVLAKALLSEAKVFIFDEPTRGIDVGAKYEVYTLIQELAARGAAIVLVSSELPEVMNLSHRTVVMSQGRVYGIYEWPDYDENRILADAFAAFTSRGMSASL